MIVQLARSLLPACGEKVAGGRMRGEPDAGLSKRCALVKRALGGAETVLDIVQPSIRADNNSRNSSVEIIIKYRDKKSADVGAFNIWLSVSCDD